MSSKHRSPDRVPSNRTQNSITPTRGNNGSNGFVQPLPPTTAVDGQGMWRAWTRVFEKPESACLDLLDNCLDATLQKKGCDGRKGFQGRIVVDCLEEEHQFWETGITIMNNSPIPVNSLDEALKVYKSSKNTEATEHTSIKDAIGENGVGLKHGCATLSDASFVLTRNRKTIDIGVIAKDLQSSHGVYLPSFSFAVQDLEDDDEVRLLIRNNIDKDDRVAEVLAKYLGKGSLSNGINKLAKRVQAMWEEPWSEEKYVFQLVICNLHHKGGAAEVIDVDNPPLSVAKAFLRDLQLMLPEYYINIPEGFDFFIDGERTIFSHWQRRLVELTRFQVNIPVDKPINSLQTVNWQDEGYNLNIYCGFDAQRIQNDNDNGGGTSCNLYFYSRQAGRLITKENDARHMLGLGASGSNYMQGLTVIIDDTGSRLPLMPTKDGLAWSEQKEGATHRNNLLAWVGAVTQCYWGEAFKKIKTQEKGEKAKEAMKNVILSFLDDQMEGVSATGSIAQAYLNTFEGLKWKKTLTKYNKLSIKRVSCFRDFFVEEGDDTIFKITDERVQRVKMEDREQAKKRPAKKKKGETKKGATAVAPVVLNEFEDLNDPVARRHRKATTFYSDSLENEINAGRREKAAPKRSTNDESDSDDNDNNDDDDATLPKHRRRKRWSNKGGTLEKRLLEIDIQLKQEQLKTLMAEKALQEKHDLISELQTELQRAKSSKRRCRKSHQQETELSNDSTLQAQLAAMKAERDNYKRRLEDLEQQTNEGRKPKSRKLQGNYARRSGSPALVSPAKMSNFGSIETI